MNRRFSEIAHGSPEYFQACSLRNETLRRPLGLDLYQENRTWEASALHYGIFQNRELIASLIAIPENGNCYRIRQMTTKTEWQGQGIGSELMEKVEGELARRGASKVSLHARTSAVRFYQRLGYHSVGEVFEEVTIPHRKMEKSFK